MPLPAPLRRAAARALVVAACTVVATVRDGHAQAAQSEDSKQQDEKPRVTFVHENCVAQDGVCRAAYNVSLEDGERFTILIKSTDPEKFTYDVAGVLAAPSPAPAGRPLYEGLKDTTLAQVHDKKYGGYIVSIRRKQDSSTTLPEATLIIGVRTAEWTVAVAGGFPVSTLVDRQYSLRDTTVGGEAQFLVSREKDHEDKASLSTATFVHLRRTALNWPRTRVGVGLSFGLGVSSNTTYFVGPSAMFGNAGALTLGAVVGSRAELPNGVNVNSLTKDANALGNPARRNAFGTFIAFSYSFLGNSSALEKPWKGTEAPTTPPDEPAQRDESTESIAVVQDGPLEKDAAVTFRVTLARDQGETNSAVAGEYRIYPATATDSALVQLDPTITLTESSPDFVSGSVRGKMLKAPTGTPLRVVLVKGDFKKELATPSLSPK